MKRTFSLIISLCFTMVLTAATVTHEEARQQALQFLSARQGTHTGRRVQAADLQLSDAIATSQLYVFNVGQQEGFIIVSGDDCTGERILGYADNGEISNATMPENLRAWLQGYAEEIAWMQQKGITNDPAAQRALHRAAVTRTYVAPLLTCQWDQLSPYDTYCPTYNAEGNHCPAGCMATAMAQVMYYQGKLKGTTTTLLKEVPAYTTKTQNYEIAAKSIRSFDWSKMADTYPAGDEANEEVARLLEYLGAIVKMDYHPDGSGANTNQIRPALVDYFGYDNDLCEVERNDYLYADWVDLVYTELTTHGPVLYSGHATDSGHAFIVDGYESEDYFHINWGWSGISDGVFKLSVCYPEEQGTGGSQSQMGFCMFQTAMINVSPVDDGITQSIAGEKYSGTANLSATLSTSGNTAGSPITVTAQVTNSGDTYTGHLELTQNGTSVAGQQVEIKSGVTSDIVFTYTPSSAGEYTLSLIDKKNSQLATTSVTVLASDATTGELTHSGISFTGVTDNEFYGNTLSGSVTFSNSSETAHSSGIKGVIWVKNGDYWNLVEACFFDTSENPIVQGTPQTFPFTFSGMTEGNSYLVTFHYLMDGSYNDTKIGEKSASLSCLYGVKCYEADGDISILAPQAEMAFSSEVLAVDLSRIEGVTTITEASNPNTLFIVGSSVPTGLDNRNVVQNGIASKLTIDSNYGFCSPVTFTASEATYTQQFTRGADGTNGWNTLVLPFDVTVVRQGETTIDWFHSGTDSGKNFWLKKFSSDDASTVYFDFADELKANVPYIIAMPGNAWGEAWNLTNRDITFCGTGVTISASPVATTSGNHFKLAGTYTQQAVTDCYVLNADGNAFVKSSTTVNPYHAFFQPFSMTVGSDVLAIGSEGGRATAITPTSLATDADSSSSTLSYDLQGCFVGSSATNSNHTSHLSKGIYIQRSLHGKNAKKVMIK